MDEFDYFESSIDKSYQNFHRLINCKQNHNNKLSWYM